MPLTPGDKVKIINENATGIVTKIISAKFILVRIGDFDYEYSIDNLIKTGNETSSFSDKILNEKNYRKIKDAIREEPYKSGIKKLKIKKGKKALFITEVDLHCSEIIADTSGMTRSQILNEQINYFMNELDTSIARHEKQIIFIHGKGEGVLKAEIHRFLNSRNFVFYEAPMRFYGGGATLVEL